jgi:hypothetical protein
MVIVKNGYNKQNLENYMLMQTLLKIYRILRNMEKYKSRLVYIHKDNLTLKVLYVNKII